MISPLNNDADVRQLSEYIKGRDVVDVYVEHLPDVWRGLRILVTVYVEVTAESVKRAKKEVPEIVNGGVVTVNEGVETVNEGVQSVIEGVETVRFGVET